MKLLLSDLRAAGACQDQVDLFRKHFKGGGTVTLARARKVASLFDWDWAARHLLSSAGQADYERVKAPALADYQRVEVPALADYQRVKASAWADYERVKAPAWAEYQRVKASAWAEYQRATAPAWAEYQRAMASAWFAAWKQDHSK
jgi:cell division septum initiation protein DivIVA